VKDKTSPDAQHEMLQRMIKAHGRRVGNRDPEALRGILSLAQVLDHATQNAVDALKSQGFSWGEIAAGIGKTRQAVEQRYGRFRSRPCTECGKRITDTFGTIEERDYCLRCHGMAILKLTK
jgi:hypothetical protein